jgi:uncharacterized protein (TIRG00374 family)
MRHVRVHPKIAVVLKVIVGVALLIGLIVYIDVKALLRSIAHADVFYLTIGALLVVANVGMQFMRWRYLIMLIGPDTSNKEIFSSLLIGYSAGFFTPGQVGEHGGRLMALSSMHAIQVLAVSIIDKMYVLAITIIAGSIGAWLYFVLFLPNYWTPYFTALVAAVVFSFLGVVLYPDLLKKILRAVLHKLRKYRAVSAFLFVKDIFHRSQARMLLLLTCIFYGIIVLQYYFFVLAFEPVSLGISALCTANILFIKSAILPISFGDLGVRESTAVFFYSHAGISAASAFNASLCVFFVNIFIPSLIGSLLILKSKSAREKLSP